MRNWSCSPLLPYSYKSLRSRHWFGVSYWSPFYFSNGCSVQDFFRYYISHQACFATICPQILLSWYLVVSLLLCMFLILRYYYIITDVSFFGCILFNVFTLVCKNDPAIIVMGSTINIWWLHWLTAHQVVIFAGFCLACSFCAFLHIILYYIIQTYKLGT